MAKEKFEDLIKKYEQGESSLLEEQIIFDHSVKKEDTSQAWRKFVQKQRIKAPEGLQDTIWESIQTRQKTNQRWRVGIISAVACILLFLSIGIYRPFESRQSDQAKEVLLKEALQLFENKDPKPELTSIYEDDMIIIYASAE